ncbi:Transgelin [Cladobotryum mycophilum]|uniref:Transgelin n=1 Tax=Cladobotryum mycophilum TaxID=491253 RepID=A0ABR0SDJ1_9HYPO
MASVTSLDKDLRKLRLEKYTPAAANEARQWIEDILGEKLSSPDLLEGLKDGVALCRLINLAIPPPGIKFKKSAMPFVQMENISHFLRACQAPPLNLQQHDTFLTVDLFEQKDPAQVLQCIGAFSRAANAANPRNIPHPMGPKTRPGTLTPQATGSGTRNRGASITSDTSSVYGGGARSAVSQDSASGRLSPSKGHGSSVSSWSKRDQESSTAPAWNIAQYGYMGGASQGNLGISFGSRRQVTGSRPAVPSLAGKERMRKEKVAEEERLQQEDEERCRARLQAEEEQAHLEEERRWEHETHRLREEERRKVEEERRQWEEQERQWKAAEEQRRKQEEEAAARIEEERRQNRNRSPAKLRGQFLSQYQAEQAPVDDEVELDEGQIRIRELERELEMARQREAEYQRERQGRAEPAPADAPAKLRVRSRSRPATPRSPKPNSTTQLNRQESWSQGGEVLHTKWHHRQQDLPEDEISRTVVAPVLSLTRPSMPPPRAPPQNRTDQFLFKNPAPVQATAQQIYARELGATQERDEEDRRRVQSQEQTKAAGWASKSLLEREMEMERERQKEWEEAQKETAAAAAKIVDSNNGVDGIGGGIGGRWDVPVEDRSWVLARYPIQPAIDLTEGGINM